MATLEIDLSEELLEETVECAEERNFATVDQFVRSAIRSSLDADNPYTEEAQERMEKAYERGEGKPVEELFEKVGIDVEDSD